MGHYIIGVTGASGTCYAKRLIERLLERGHQIHLCMTRAARLVAASELGWEEARLEDETYLRILFHAGEALHCHPIDAIGASIASGSFPVDGMVILPCSMGTLSGVARGASQNLLERAADVCLKERRTLILVPREAPFNQIHLENMLSLSHCGAVIMPACPSFYHGPETIGDLVDFFCARIQDQLGLRDDSIKRWSGL